MVQCDKTNRRKTLDEFALEAEGNEEEASLSLFNLHLAIHHAIEDVALVADDGDPAAVQDYMPRVRLAARRWPIANGSVDRSTKTSWCTALDTTTDFARTPFSGWKTGCAKMTAAYPYKAGRPTTCATTGEVL